MLEYSVQRMRMFHQIDISANDVQKGQNYHQRCQDEKCALKQLLFSCSLSLSCHEDINLLLSNNCSKINICKLIYSEEFYLLIN